MKLSLLTFSLMGEALTRQMDAEKLCKIAGENGIEGLSLRGEHAPSAQCGAAG